MQKQSNDIILFYMRFLFFVSRLKKVLPLCICLIILFSIKPIVSAQTFSCGYCLSTSDPYTPMGQCVFYPSLPQCSPSMDINGDGNLDAGDLSACARCRVSLTPVPPTATPSQIINEPPIITTTPTPTTKPTATSQPTVTTGPTITTVSTTPTASPSATVSKNPTPSGSFTPSPSKNPEQCTKKKMGDADCKADTLSRYVNILDYAIWYSEFIKDCSSTNVNACGSDADGNGDLMDANFNYPGTSHIATDTKVTIFDYAVWIQGMSLEVNQ